MHSWFSMMVKVASALCTTALERKCTLGQPHCALRRPTRPNLDFSHTLGGVSPSSAALVSRPVVTPSTVPSAVAGVWRYAASSGMPRSFPASSLLATAPQSGPASISVWVQLHEPLSAPALLGLFVSPLPGPTQP
jgi:hypothetical protein